jgi:signal transduction histidine kinase
VSFLSRRLRLFVAVALGAGTGLVALGYLIAAGVVVAVVAATPAREQVLIGVGAGARRLALVDRRRVVRWLGSIPQGDPDAGRAVAYVAGRVPVGLLGGLLFLLLGWGAATVVALVAGWAFGWPVDGIEPSPFNVAYLSGAAALLLFLNLEGIAAVGRIDRALAQRLLVPSSRAAYERRIAELATARSDVVAVVDAERRRIERDLHDGVQQRLVAVGMLIGRARRLERALGADPPGAAAERARLAELLRQAHDEAADALVDLREVSWRVFPAALDAGGLSDALETVADRSPVPVTLTLDLGDRPVTAVETVAYFVVSEAVTNAIKHAGASRIEVTVRRTGGELVVGVRDDGGGGADPTGGGLTGLSRRVLALDGGFTVVSPPGGPTTIEAVLPCG